MHADDQEQSFVYELMNKYVPYFDVDKNVLLGEMPLAFVAIHKRKDERYMMTRKIKVWEVENQQVIFVAWLEEEVTTSLVQQFLQTVEKHYKTYIPSYSEHMSTIFIAMILTNQPVHENALKEVKKYRKIKFMKFVTMDGQKFMQQSSIITVNRSLFIQKENNLYSRLKKYF